MYLILLFASLAIFLTVIAVYARQPFASVFHPISFYLVFHGFVFVIRPFFALWFDYGIIYVSFQFTPSPDAKTAAIVVANIGLLAGSSEPGEPAQRSCRFARSAPIWSSVNA